MKRILITGASGMVGQNLLAHQAATGHHILCPSSKQLNLKDFNAVHNYLAAEKPDFIIHAAGKVGGIQANMADPISFLDDNLIIGRNLVLAARDAGIKNFLNLGSTCMYPRNAKNPLVEDSILAGELEPTNEGYALAKIMVDRLCQYISRQHQVLNYKTIIPCNLYGPFDKFSPENSHLVPAIIHKIHIAKMQGQQTVDIWGDGTVRREFMYAGDLADAIWKAVSDFDAAPNIFNCGLGHDYSVNEYYQAAARMIGWNGEFIHLLDKPVGMKQKLADVSRQKYWGWTPSTSLEDGLAKTYEFYLSGEKS